MSACQARLSAPGPDQADVSAWQHFWSHAGATRCVPDSQPALSLTSSCWREFARNVASGGRVLDLGTGRGYVLHEIGAERSDLVLVGVDAVRSLPLQHTGLHLRLGVSIEALPFADDEFDALCSQFGFEYSDVEAAAPEVARVLRPGGKLRFLIHHAQGIVVRQSARRKAALEWALDESGILEKAAELVGSVESLSRATAATWREATAHARAQSRDPVAGEVAAAVRQLVLAGEEQWTLRFGRPLASLVHQARNELTILAAIERAAMDDPRIQRLLALLGSAGLETTQPRVLTLESDTPFGWLIEATKPIPDQC